MTDVALTKVSETSSKITFSYPKVAGVEGYRYFVNGNAVSRTLNPDDLEVTFGKVAGATYRVVPLDVSERTDGFVWPAPTTPTPQPPPGLKSPLGYLSNKAPGYFPATHIDQYGVISSEGPAPAAFKGVNLVYRSTVTCGAGYTNMGEQECVAGGWAMVGTNGETMRNGQYGGVLGDPGHAGYRQRWLELTVTYMQQHQADSFWGDDFTARVADFNGGVWPQKYPNMQTYQQNALVPFAQFMKAELGKRGLVAPAYNASVSLDDDASQTAAWWATLGKHVGYLSAEYWLVANGHVRREAGGWDNNWSGWRNLHKVCLTAGCKFLPFPSVLGQVYTLATFLLDDDQAGGACMWVPEGVGGGEYNSTTDPWIAEYGKAAALGAASGPATKSGNVWTRQFANGRVTVDPVVGTASIG